MFGRLEKGDVMKKGLIVLGLALSLVFSGLDKAFAEGKFAVVDVKSVVENSAQVKKLKADQIKKSKELAKWIETVRADINKQTTDESKEKLSKKYDAELTKKREESAKVYSQRLNEIDKSISNTISTYAKNNGYDMVFSKSATLYGGDDITAAISKIVK